MTSDKAKRGAAVDETSVYSPVSDSCIKPNSTDGFSVGVKSADSNSVGSNSSDSKSVIRNAVVCTLDENSKIMFPHCSKTKDGRDCLDSFYKGKRVLVTGHTGFKGGWLVTLLHSLGAQIVGYALPPASLSAYTLLGGDKLCKSVTGDVRDLALLKQTFDEFQPEIVLHLAAQPIVLESYKKPAYTFETNVMGTVNVLECVRLCPSVKSFLNITTDKVYKNNEWHWGYRETDELCGLDPYSNSKSCSELVTHSYKQSFLSDCVAVSTARAGNVIGGGDFAADRIIPDCVRSALSGSAIFVRNPHSIRPYQHVLEPLFAYLRICMAQYNNIKLAGSYNVGPNESDSVSTGELADIFCKAWGDIKWTTFANANAPHEASFLQLDTSKIKKVLGISPVWSLTQAVEMTVRFAKLYAAKKDLFDEALAQIKEFRTAAGV